MRCRVLVAGAILAGAAQAEALDEDRRGELERLLLHDCGSCHGLRLEGGLGPALTPSAMRKKSPEYLRAAIRDGIPGTAMPPWGPLLSEADIAYLVQALRAERP